MMKMKMFTAAIIAIAVTTLAAYAGNQERPLSKAAGRDRLERKTKDIEPIRVLAIGNSFSMDAVEQNLHEIAEAVGVPMIIGNMYIGGCSIDRHVENLRTDTPDYAYRKIGLDGRRSDTPGFTLARAICDESWDYVSVQQVSQDSGMPESYGNLPELLAWIRANAPQAKIIFHQTWAYSKDSGHAGFANFGRDQQRMYEAIVRTVREQARRNNIYKVVPSGTAIQNARQTILGDNLTRDGYHLDYRIGRYIAAAAWFETLTGKNVAGNPWSPAEVSPEELRAAQMAAHKAIRRPCRVSRIPGIRTRNGSRCGRKEKND